MRRVVISGVQLVTIPAAEYADLLGCRQLLAERKISTEVLFGKGRTKIDRNPEVAVFLAQRLGLEPVNTILKKCRRQFGAARTPSQSATYRYWERLRKEASKTV